MKKFGLLKEHLELITTYFQSHPPGNCEKAVESICALVGRRYSPNYIRSFLKKQGIAYQKQQERSSFSKKEVSFEKLQNIFEKSGFDKQVLFLAAKVLASINTSFLKGRYQIKAIEHVVETITLHELTRETVLHPICEYLLEKITAVLAPVLKNFIHETLHSYFLYCAIKKVSPDILEYNSEQLREWGEENPFMMHKISVEAEEATQFFYETGMYSLIRVHFVTVISSLMT